jgi:predicted RNA-binding protein with PUA-like domain
MAKKEQKYWLLKTEPEGYSIDDLKRDKVEPWSGVRNYQARNFMQSMSVGDLCLFYHSSTDPTGVVGIAKVVAKAHSDQTQFDRKSHYFDPKATIDKPIWYCADIGFIEKFKHTVTLFEIKLDPKLQGMLVRERGSRLSVQPVSEKHFIYIRHVLARNSRGV